MADLWIPVHYSKLVPANRVKGLKVPAKFKLKLLTKSKSNYVVTLLAWCLVKLLASFTKHSYLHVFVLCSLQM